VNEPTGSDQGASAPKVNASKASGKSGPPAKSGPSSNPKKQQILQTNPATPHATSRQRAIGTSTVAGPFLLYPAAGWSTGLLVCCGRTRERFMLRILGWAILIIFIIGLLVVIGIFDLVF